VNLGIIDVLAFDIRPAAHLCNVSTTSDCLEMVHDFICFGGQRHVVEFTFASYCLEPRKERIRQKKAEE